MKKLLSAVLSLGLVLATAGVVYSDWNEAINPPSITSTGAIATTGILTGAVGVISKGANYTLGTDASKEAYGYWVFVTATATVTLPAVATGMSVCVYSTTAAAVHVDPDGSEVVTLDGTALTGGTKVTSDSGAGDFICLIGDGSGWTTLGRSGTWTDGS